MWGFNGLRILFMVEGAVSLDGEPREIRAAKTIFNVSGGPARHRSVAAACGSGSHRFR